MLTASYTSAFSDHIQCFTAWCAAGLEDHLDFASV